MGLRERQIPQNAESTEVVAADAQVDELREAAASLIEAGDSIIDRVLSADSRQYLRANQQDGGQ